MLLQEMTMTDNKIKALLKERPPKQNTMYWLAKQTGLKNNTIQSLTKADRFPDGTRLGTLRLIAETLGVSIVDLLDE